MIGLLQRVSRADVTVDGTCIAEIDAGLLVLIGVQKDDTRAHADRLLERLLGYRVFEDTNGKMNDSLLDVGGGLLLVPQFTLAADTRKGRRPSFSGGASPAWACELFEYLVDCARAQVDGTQAGRFGAEMQVGLINQGPVTFWLEV